MFGIPHGRRPDPVPLGPPIGRRLSEEALRHPQGAPGARENPSEAALRETKEETGLEVHLVADLGTSRYKSGKEVHCFLAELVGGKVDEKGNTAHDWEIDVSKFYPLETCRKIIHPDQEVFLDRALSVLEATHLKAREEDNRD